MRRTVVLGARAWRTLASVVAATLLAGVGTSYLWAEGESVSVVKVWEEWELVVAEVDPDRSAPQVTVVLSPLGDLNGLYAAFELNHQSQPTYTGGGLQLQVWNANEVPAATRTQKDRENLHHANETITWTQKMELANGYITFDIDDGVSQSWGSFGEGVIATVPTTLSNLNAYNPLVSVNGSGVGFSSNRVTSLKLKKVTVHLSTGQVLVDDTVKVAFPKQ
jgi:hypothetical protein